MRVVGTVLMLVGAFALGAVALSIFGPGLRAEGIDVGAVVTSVPATLIAGCLALIGGAYLRRRSRQRRTAQRTEVR